MSSLRNTARLDPRPRSPRSVTSFTFSEHRVTAGDPGRPTSRGFKRGRCDPMTVAVRMGLRRWRRRSWRDSPTAAQNSKVSAGFLILFLDRVYPTRVSLAMVLSAIEALAVYVHRHRREAGTNTAEFDSRTHNRTRIKSHEKTNARYPEPTRHQSGSAHRSHSRTGRSQGTRPPSRKPRPFPPLWAVSDSQRIRASLPRISKGQTIARRGAEVPQIGLGRGVQR